MITFPTTTEAFIAYQEAGTGRKLGGFERNLAAVVVELINIILSGGHRRARAHCLSERMRKDSYQERGKRGGSFSRLARIWESICWWCNQAYQAGAQGITWGQCCHL